MTRDYPTAHLISPLSENELEELDRFLISDLIAEESLSLDALDGYLTAIAIGPSELAFDDWFFGIWGPGREYMPNFEAMDNADHIVNLIVRHLNYIQAGLENDPDNIQLIFESLLNDQEEEYLDPRMWAYGFLCGMDLSKQDWYPLFDDPDGQEALYPIYLLGTDNVSDEEKAKLEPLEQRAALTELIPLCVAAIYRFWRSHPRQNTERKSPVASKAKQDDLCQCGSGKKFRNCCGISSIMH